MPGGLSEVLGEGEPGLGGGGLVGVAAPDEGHVPVDLRLDQGEAADVGAMRLRGNHARDKGNADVGGNEFHDEIHLARLRHDAGFESVLMAGAEDEGIQGKASAVEDE